MKTGGFYNAIQEGFSRVYGLTTGREPYPLRSFLLQKYQELSPRKILDVGCGSGSYALPGYNYLGVDPNPYYIDYCRRQRLGEFRQMSAENLDFPEKTFDVVLCFSVAHHLPDEALKRTCSEIKRVMTDDGTLFFADPIRPIVGLRPVAALLEWLDEGRWFRTETDYLDLLGDEFLIEQKRRIVDQFYSTLVLSCRKNQSYAIG